MSNDRHLAHQRIDIRAVEGNSEKPDVGAKSRTSPGVGGPFPAMPPVAQLPDDGQPLSKSRRRSSK